MASGADGAVGAAACAVGGAAAVGVVALGWAGVGVGVGAGGVVAQPASITNAHKIDVLRLNMFSPLFRIG
ncbi:hypothetical protein LF63_0109380 [Oleiagrimonas soli]|uniref:Uncharacterized protein n=1 Tax=Oleiagrimonas soli TaxID=1543381 RepID=A0A099CX28_9GAMM|nr:hypothetical protein LF63_0109380 [Oleiagrimonas soli]